MFGEKVNNKANNNKQCIFTMPFSKLVHWHHGTAWFV